MSSVLTLFTYVKILCNQNKGFRVKKLFPDGSLIYSILSNPHYAQTYPQGFPRNQKLLPGYKQHEPDINIIQIVFDNIYKTLKL